MTRYIARALEESNPCGVQGIPKAHSCKRAEECTGLGQETGGFLCVPKMGYEVAQYLQNGSNTETERCDLGEFVRTGIGRKKFVDPRETEWQPQVITSQNANGLIDKVVTEGQRLYRKACAKGSERDPVNFHCKMVDIVRDL